MSEATRMIGAIGTTGMTETTGTTGTTGTSGTIGASEIYGTSGAQRSESQIVPLLAGSNANALDLSRRLDAAGIYAPAIRPPTVPKNESRLRFSLTSAHTEADLARLEEALLALSGSKFPANFAQSPTI